MKLIQLNLRKMTKKISLLLKPFQDKILIWIIVTMKRVKLLRIPFNFKNL